MTSEKQNKNKSEDPVEYLVRRTWEDLDEWKRNATIKSTFWSLVETLLGLGLIIRLGVHSLGYKFLSGEEPEIKYRYSLEPPIQNRGITKKLDLSIRVLSLLTGLSLYILFTSRAYIDFTYPILITVILGNLLVLLLDPIVGMIYWIQKSMG